MHVMVVYPTEKREHMVCAIAVIPELMLLLVLTTRTEAIQSSWYYVYHVDGKIMNPELCMHWSC